jgi:hypothetical protein
MKHAQSIFDFIIVTAAVAVVIAAWTWLALLPFGGIPPALIKLEAAQQPTTLAKLGTYGDMFGALTCLFTGLGFVGAGYAVVLQLRALRHQQDEMERAAKEREKVDEIRKLEKVLFDSSERRMAMLNTTNFLAQTYAAKLAALPIEPISHADRKGLEETRKQRADIEEKLANYIEVLSTLLMQISKEQTRSLHPYLAEKQSS